MAEFLQKDCKPPPSVPLLRFIYASFSVLLKAVAYKLSLNLITLSQTLHFNNINSREGNSNQSVPIVLPVTNEDKQR